MRGVRGEESSCQHGGQAGRQLVMSRDVTHRHNTERAVIIHQELHHFAQENTEFTVSIVYHNIKV